MPAKLSSIYELLSPENIQTDFSDEELIARGVPAEEIAKLGKIATIRPSETLGETATQEEMDASIEEKIRALHEEIKEKPLPGGMSQKRH